MILLGFIRFPNLGNNRLDGLAAASQLNCEKCVALFGVWYTIYLTGGLNLLTSTKNLTVISRAHACDTLGKDIVLIRKIATFPCRV
ncbi:MAG: hypothetical protein EBY38_09040 [Flavobacteriaceae bacterium]|nr:hypothetical protein [Flavobacteriaceae bacterium]